MTLLEAALAYAERGIPVFPLHPRAKQPIGSLVPNGKDDASTDPTLIRAWWAKSPSANVGGVMGAVCDVLDVDPRHGGDETWRELRFVNRYAHDGPCATTGSGGEHLFFKPASLPRRIGFAPGLDWITNGYVVLPPSIHESGKPYAWDVDLADMPLPDAPDWLCAMVRGGQTSAALDIPSLIANPLAIAEGEKHTIIVRFIYRVMREGWPIEQTRLAVAAMVSQFPESRLKERKDAAILKYSREVDSCYTKFGVQTTTAEAETGHAFKLLSAPELFERPAKPMLVHGFMGSRDSAMTYGQRKSGKTFVVLDCLLSMACGEMVAGRFRPERPLSVLYCTGEGHSALGTRVRAMVEDRGLDMDLLTANFHVVERTPQLNSPEGAADSWAAFSDALALQNCDPDLVAIDTMHNAMRGADENATQDMGVAIHALAQIRERLECATWLVHHENKAGTVRGNSAMDGSLDLQTQVIESGPTRLLRYSFAKDLAAFDDVPFHLRQVTVGDALYSVETVVVDWDGPTEATTTRSVSAQIEDVMRSTPGAPEWTVANIAAALAHISVNTVKQTMKRERSLGGDSRFTWTREDRRDFVYSLRSPLSVREGGRWDD